MDLLLDVQLFGVRLQLLGHGYDWLDTVTIDSLVEIVEFVQIIKKATELRLQLLKMLPSEKDEFK